LVAQTDQNFRVYVGDDGGPPEIARVCAEFSKLDLIYHRYPENLGGHSLVGHWNRCVRLSQEPWIWLFSDDDAMSPDCVAAFYEGTSLEPSTDLWRFNTSTINADGMVVRHSPTHPPVESGADFLFARLQGERSSFAAEYIFSRIAFERAGGLADYPAGWCADDASWFLFARESGIRTFPLGHVGWRSSAYNISSCKGRFRRERLTAAAKFVDFLQREVVPRDRNPRRSQSDWYAAAKRWLRNQIRYVMPVGPKSYREAARISADAWQAGVLRKYWQLSWWDLQSRR
jgi:glycosyltransferase involved in cell wall biosynthesis